MNLEHECKKHKSTEINANNKYEEAIKIKFVNNAFFMKMCQQAQVFLFDLFSNS